MRSVNLTTTTSHSAQGHFIEIEENLSAPELYATEATYFGVTGPNATVTLTSLRWDNSAEPPVLKRVVVGRLVMPISAAQALAVALYDHLAKNGYPVKGGPSDPKQVQ